MEKVKFPLYVRCKVSWSIDKFNPSLLRDRRFYQLESPEFSIALNSAYNDVTKWWVKTTQWHVKVEPNLCLFHSLSRQLSVVKSQTCISCFLKLIDCNEQPKYKKYQRLSVYFDVGILNTDGTISNQTKGIIPRLAYRERMGRLTNYRELSKDSRRLKLLNGNKFTIVVRLDLVENVSTPSMKNVMAMQYEKLFNNKKFSDFTLVTADKTEIPVHKNIMSIRSPVFETMMETKMRESKENKATIEDIDGKALMELLRFLYSGRVENLDDVACDLLYAATKYDVPDLKPLCVSSLTKQLSPSNVIETMMLADLHNEQELKSFCVDYIKWCD